jgi:hypothetical protein
MTHLSWRQFNTHRNLQNTNSLQELYLGMAHILEKLINSRAINFYIKPVYALHSKYVYSQHKATQISLWLRHLDTHTTWRGSQFSSCGLQTLQIQKLF